MIPNPEPSESTEDVKQIQDFDTLLNDIFISESLESLDYLQSYIQLARNGDSIGEAVMHIKDAWTSLHDTAGYFEVEQIQTALSMLHRISREQLHYNEQPPDDVLDVMDDAERLIRQYLENNQAYPDLSGLIDKMSELLQKDKSVPVVQQKDVLRGINKRNNK